VSSVPIRVGLVGTGFAAKVRAQTLFKSGYWCTQSPLELLSK